MGEGRGIYSVAMFQKERHDFRRVFLFGFRRPMARETLRRFKCSAEMNSASAKVPPAAKRLYCANAPSCCAELQCPHLFCQHKLQKPPEGLMLQEVFTAGKYQGLFVTDYQQGIYQISLRLPCRIWSRCEVSASNFNADASSTA